jgi:hypothetical protein
MNIKVTGKAPGSGPGRPRDLNINIEISDKDIYRYLFTLGLTAQKGAELFEEKTTERRKDINGKYIMDSLNSSPEWFPIDPVFIRLNYYLEKIDRAALVAAKKEDAIQLIRQEARTRGFELGKEASLDKAEKEISKLKINHKEELSILREEHKNRIKLEQRLSYARCLEAVQKASVVIKGKLFKKEPEPEEIRDKVLKAVEDLYHSDYKHYEEKGNE